MPDVIVLLPGIMGSTLRKNGKDAWGFKPGAITRAIFTLGDSIAKDLRLGGDDPTRETLDDGVTADGLASDLTLLPGFWKVDGYSHVADVLQETFDVTEGQNFFRFAYDWRRDNRVAANRLRRLSHDWLKRWREQSPGAKLILVGHSMGGIVSRYFLEVLDGWKDTKALITFGTPYRGSLNALDTLSNGMRKGPFTLEDMTEFGRSCTSIYQLLPVYESIDMGNGKLARVGESTGIPKVDAARCKAALAFHREIIDAVDAHLKEEDYQKNRYRVFPIVGITQETNQSAQLAGGKVTVSRQYLGEDMSGDGTVPRVSAIPHEYSHAGNAMFAAMKHGSLQNTDTILQHVEGAITSLYQDLGKFLKPDRRSQLSLIVEDVFFDTESVMVEAEGETDDLELTATITNSVTGAVEARAPMQSARRDTRYHVELPPLAEGSYRVTVDGGSDVTPVTDAFGVTPQAV
jgi:hypothetical protein